MPTPSAIYFTRPHTDESNESLYTPLENEEALRLCYIEPGKWNDPVKCRMITRPADDEDECKCLSYPWEDPKEPVTIQVNSHSLPVTRKLHSAMRRLRWHGLFGALWVDALCTNQTDIAEKSVQVSRMANTYAQAYNSHKGR